MLRRILVCVVGLAVLATGGYYGYRWLSSARAETPVAKDAVKPVPAGPATTAKVKGSTGESETQVSAVASIEATSEVIKAGCDVSTLIKQNSKIDDETKKHKVNTSVSQSIEMRGGEPACTYEMGEADLKRAEGKAKIEANRAKYGVRVGKAEPPPTAKVDLTVHSDVSGRVEVGGKIDASGTITHGGSISHTGNVHHDGEVRVGSGTITVNGVTKTVTVRERYDACGRLISRTAE